MDSRLGRLDRIRVVQLHGAGGVTAKAAQSRAHRIESAIDDVTGVRVSRREAHGPGLSVVKGSNSGHVH